MKVLHVISGLDHRSGGPAYALLGLATYQQREGLEVTVLVASRDGDDPAIIESMRAERICVDQIAPCHGPLERHPQMRSTVDRAVSKADICHLHAVWSQIQHDAAQSCVRLGVPYIIRPCGMLDPWCLAQSRLKKWLYMRWRLRRDLQKAALIHFTTETERRLAEPLGLSTTPIVESNGVDLEEFDDLPEKGEFRRQFPEVGDRPILLFLSRIHRKKGLDLLIPAFAKARSDDAILVIVGPDDGGYRAKVEGMVEEYEQENDVLFTGLLRGRDRLCAMVEAELYVLPSYQENFGVAVVEAIAAGLPVVISDQVNIHDEITRHGLGVVVSTNVDALAVELERWLGDESLRQTAAGKGPVVARQLYDWAEIAHRWRDHYELVHRGRAAHSDSNESTMITI